MKDKLARVILIVCFLAFIFIDPISRFVGIDLMVLKKQYPGFPFLFNGVCLIILGFLGIVFRDEFGRWAADYRQGLADKYPAWKKMSGLPDDEVKYYFTVEFNRKMVMVASLILIVVGIILVAIGTVFKG